MDFYLAWYFIENAGFSSEGEVFCKSRDKSSVADLYLSYIKQQLSEFSVSSNSEHIAALIIEPGK